MGGHGAQGLHLLLAHVDGVEGHRRLHRGEGEKLEHVVGDHVAQGSGLFIKSGAGADAEGFGAGDLDVVDVVAMPDGLEQGVGKAEDQDVLHRLLAEIMVDAKTCSSSKAPSTVWLSARAEARSRPKGFSTMMRVQPLAAWARPLSPR